MSNTFVKKNSAGNRILSSIIGIFIGIGMVIICLILLGWNERRNVKAIRAFDEVEKVYVETGSARVNPANEGMLVAIKGDLSYTDIGDNEYNFTVTSFILQRNVEMYQWHQRKKGGSSDEKTEYSYYMDWAAARIDSSMFEYSGYDNPSWPQDSRFQSRSFFSQDAKLGDFNLSESHLRDLGANLTVPLPDTGLSIPSGFSLNDNYITNTGSTAQLGDIRVSFRSSNLNQASALAKQSGSDLINYKAKNNTIINRIFPGLMTGDSMLQTMRDENTFLTWVLRIVFSVLVCLGFIMIFSPVTLLISFIPFLGKILGSVTKGLSMGIGFIIGIALSLTVIAVSWVLVRPLVAIPLLIAVGGLVYLIIYLGNRNKSISN